MIYTTSYESLLFDGFDLMQSSIYFKPNIRAFPALSTIHLKNTIDQDALYRKIHQQMDNWKKEYIYILSKPNMGWEIVSTNHLPKHWVIEKKYISSVYWNLLALAENFGIDAYNDFLKAVKSQNIALHSVSNFWVLVNQLVGINTFDIEYVLINEQEAQHFGNYREYLYRSENATHFIPLEIVQREFQLYDLTSINLYTLTDKPISNTSCIQAKKGNELFIFQLME